MRWPRHSGEVHAKQQVVDALQSKVNNAKNLLADAKGEGHAQVHIDDSMK